MGLTHVSELGSNRKLVFVGVCRREHCEIAWDGGTEGKADCCSTVADVCCAVAESSSLGRTAPARRRYRWLDEPGRHIFPA